VPRRYAKLVAAFVLGPALVIGALIAPDETAFAVPQDSDGGCFTVHVGPQVKAGRTASYFQVTITPGKVGDLALMVANPENRRCQVDLNASYGQTAVNSGDTYPAVARGRCKRTSCWLSGLPASVVLPPRARILVPFRVTVPVGTHPGQYLAGVLARPYVRPGQAAPSPGARVGAFVNTSVGIGVAIIVPGPLHPLLSVPSVNLGTDGGTPLLRIVEHNAGNTWEHPAGGAVIAVGQERAVRFGVSSSTILPGDSATLTLPVTGTPSGRHATTVILWYAHDAKKAVWTSVISYPVSAAPAPSPHGSQVVVTTVETPGWVIVLALTLGALVLVLVTALLFLMFRRRRYDDAHEPPGPRHHRRAAAGRREKPHASNGNSRASSSPGAVDDRVGGRT